MNQERFALGTRLLLVVGVGGLVIAMVVPFADKLRWMALTIILLSPLAGSIERGVDFARHRHWGLIVVLIIIWLALSIVGYHSLKKGLL